MFFNPPNKDGVPLFVQPDKGIMNLKSTFIALMREQGTEVLESEVSIIGRSWSGMVRYNGKHYKVNTEKAILCEKIWHYWN